MSTMVGVPIPPMDGRNASYGCAPDTRRTALTTLSFTYRRDGETINDEITAAYIGRYDSIAAAQAAGAKDVKDVLFLDGSADGGGYGANFSSPVSVVIFAGEDGTEGQRIYKYSITAEETPIELSGNTLVRFNGLRDSEGRYINCYVVDVEEDSYGDYNYLTILVEEDTDLTQLAPTFYLTEETMNLYAEGSSTPEVSGESVHDFFNGPVQYSVSAEDRGTLQELLAADHQAGNRSKYAVRQQFRGRGCGNENRGGSGAFEAGSLYRWTFTTMSTTSF